MYEANNPVIGLGTGLAILDKLHDSERAGVSELAEELELSPGAVHHHLSTLRQYNFVTKDGDHYRLSLKFKVYGEFALYHEPAYLIGRTEVDKLANDTGEYGHLVTEEHGRSIKLHQHRGDKAIGQSYQRMKRQNMEPLHYTAAGKVLLAFMDRSHAERVISYYGLPKRTANTITEEQALYEELDRIREAGYSVNDEEEIEGIRAIGAPILDRDGSPVVAVSLSAPTERFTFETIEKTIAPKVTETANIIEANLNMKATGNEEFQQFVEP